jgi:hypothetical protein
MFMFTEPCDELSMVVTKCFLMRHCNSRPSNSRRGFADLVCRRGVCTSLGGDTLAAIIACEAQPICVGAKTQARCWTTGTQPWRQVAANFSLNFEAYFNLFY